MNDFAKEAVLAAESRFLDKHFDLSINEIRNENYNLKNLYMNLVSYKRRVLDIGINQFDYLKNNTDISEILKYSSKRGSLNRVLNGLQDFGRRIDIHYDINLITAKEGIIISAKEDNLITEPCYVFHIPVENIEQKITSEPVLAKKPEGNYKNWELWLLMFLKCSHKDHLIKRYVKNKDGITVYIDASHINFIKTTMFSYEWNRFLEKEDFEEYLLEKCENYLTDI